MSNHGVLTPIYYGKISAAASDRGTGSPARWFCAN